MKRLIEEVAGDGLESLLGKEVVLFCMNYFYAGELSGVSANDIVLSNPKIIYSTGSFDEKGWADAQRVCVPELYIRTQSIESYGEVQW